MAVRVYKLAKELGFSSKELIEKLKKLKVKVTGHMSSLDDETVEILKHELQGESKKKKLKVQEERKKTLISVEVTFPITIKDLAVKLKLKSNELIKELMKKKIFANINQFIEKDVCCELAEAYKFELKEKLTEEEELLSLHEDKITDDKLVTRAPVVTFMGHVDHGKTLLLDAIRKTNVVDREAGGITQHIGAYEAVFNNHKITFLDTPGHEAFTAMRARGAHITDIVILVVAADDGIMPQTIEAIDHARAAKVPIIVAINKIDKLDVNIDKVKRQLQEIDLAPEEWGGETIVACVSAKTKEGIEHLLEMIILQAEMMELKANPDRLARGTIIEARLTKGSGVIATLLVESGTLRLQNFVITGLHYAKIKAMMNDKEQRITLAGPSTPVEILGLSGIPEAGDTFYAAEDEKKAKNIVLNRRQERREKELSKVKKISLEDLAEAIHKGKVKTLKIIIKTDVHGSLEALCASLDKIENTEVKLSIIHKGVGSINESDVMLAMVSEAVIIGFGVGKESKANETAKNNNIEIKLYSVIYEVISDIRMAMEGLLEPYVKRSFLGRASIRQVFKVSKAGIIAGCMVTKGTILRGAEAQIIREDEVIFTGTIDSLKRFKDDVKEIKEGFECGIGFKNFNDIKISDNIEVFRLEKIKKTL